MNSNKFKGVIIYLVIIFLLIFGLVSVLNMASGASRSVTSYSSVMAEFDSLNVSEFQLDLGSGALIDMSAYGPIISETLFEDEYYGVPYRSTLYSLYYNKTLFDKKGIAYPEKITWDEYRELAKQLTYEEDGTQYWGGFLADWLGAPLSAYQRGSNLLDDDLSAIKEWVSIWNDVMNVDKSHMSFAQQTAESIDWLKFFCLGTTGMLINGEWTISMLKDYQAQGIELPDWDVTYLPAFDTTGVLTSAK